MTRYEDVTPVDSLKYTSLFDKVFISTQTEVSVKKDFIKLYDVCSGIYTLYINDTQKIRLDNKQGYWKEENQKVNFSLAKIIGEWITAKGFYVSPN